MNNDQENKYFSSSPFDNSDNKNIKAALPRNGIVKASTPFISYSGSKARRRRFSFQKLIFPLFCILFLYLLICFYAEKRITPEIKELAEAQAQKHLLATVNAAVGEMAARGDVRYDNMVHTIRDARGEVIYLEVDTAMLAGAKAKLVAAVEESLEKNNKIKLSVPLGSISGWNLFSGIGLPIRVRIHPIGMTEGEIFTELEDCGINQTRHLIQIQIKASLYIVIPGQNTQVNTQVTLPLGERVLVGDVPEIYLDTLGVG